MNISRKISCGGFNLDDSLLLNDKNTLATAIGGGVDSEPTYVRTIVGAEDKLVINRAFTEISGIAGIGDLNLPEALINPKETITDVIVEYEVEYAGFKASKVELYQDEDIKYYSIGGASYGEVVEVMEKGSLYLKSVPFILVQSFDIYGPTGVFFVTHPDYLGHTLVLRAKYYAVKPIGMSFTTAPNVLFSVPTMSTNAVVDCNVAPEYIYKILSNIENPINPTHPYIPIFSLYDKTNKQMYNSSGWGKKRNPDAFSISFNGTPFAIRLEESEIKLVEVVG